MLEKIDRPTNHPSEPARAEGFTLIEMMIVVVIVVILATVALVAYQRHLHSGRLVGAQGFVSVIQARQETYFQQHGTYADVSTSNFYPTLASPEPASKDWTTPPQEWRDLGARPPGAATYFSFFVRASVGPNHPLDANAAALRIPAQPASPMTPHPWYYIVAHGDLDGDATYSNGGCSGGSVLKPLECTIITATSADSSIIVRNRGE